MVVSVVIRPGRRRWHGFSYVQSRDRVWICRREEIARHWWMAEHPVWYP